MIVKTRNEAIFTDALYNDSELGPTLRELPAVTPLTDHRHGRLAVAF